MAATSNPTRDWPGNSTNTNSELANALYQLVAKLPIVSPHGHVDAKMLAQNTPFANPAELFIFQDHYVTRLLHAAGYSLEDLGKGKTDEPTAIKAWNIFCSNFHLFAGTASGYWLNHEFSSLFGITQTPSAANATQLYQQIAQQLNQPQFLPRALFKAFDIQFLATTDDPIDTLEHHQMLRQDPTFDGRVVPTFRPDKYLDPRASGWNENIGKLIASAKLQTVNYQNYLAALQDRRNYFIANGAVSADHGVFEPYTCLLTEQTASAYFDAAIAGTATELQLRDFAGHMLAEMARMSCDDGLVMTIHAGVVRNHSTQTFVKYGADTGHDIPVSVEFTQNLRPMLEAYGLHPNLTVILFCLDETAWGREIAPLAGFYPSVRIGAPWWFLDAPDSAMRFREKTTEIAGFYRGSGFIDDTRAFLSIPARHDMARRVDCEYLAKLVQANRITFEQAKQIAVDLVAAIPKAAFKL